MWPDPIPISGSRPRDVPGSWWPEWSSWLREQAGAEVRAFKTVGSRKHPRIEAAPGRYMKEKDSETG
jgi:polyhydroxyalkanoate synthase